MRNFWRSLRYLRPYRRTLAVSVVCVLFISVLWGGGLGIVLPVMKVMVAPEGLHGWIYNTMASDRIEADFAQQPLDPPKEVAGKPFSRKLYIQRAPEGDLAYESGLRLNEWVIGLDDGRGEHAVIVDANRIARLLAFSEAERFDLRVYNPDSGEIRTVEIRPRPLSFYSRWAGDIAAAVPEPEGMGGRFPIFLGLLGLILAVTMLRNLFRFIQEYLVESTVVRAIMDIRADAYDTALRLPVTFFSKEGTSDTTSRFIKDSNILTEGQVTLFGKTLAEPGKAIGALVMAFLLSWKLTLLAMIAGPPTLFLIRRLAKRMRKASKRALEGWSQILAVLEETLVGIRVVKAYTMEGQERKRFFRANRRLLKQQKRMAKIDAASSPLIEALGMAAGMVAAGLGGYWVLHQHMDFATFVAWMGVLAALFDPLRKLGKVVTRFHKADAAAARIFEVIDQPQEPARPAAPSLGRHERSVEFDGVSYRYPGARQDAVNDVSLKVTHGQRVAIVGPNGSGKTTLLSLLPRLIEPTAGAVLVDGRDVSEFSLRSLRRQIGLVTQETVIFHATVYENVAYGLRRPHREDVLAAAEQAYVADFVDELPDGYDTMVGEHGATLSGGQRQRIAIARAILRDPSILIFDEATSQIDSESEQRIQQAMEQFCRNRTTFLIAHRFATVLSADSVVVMNEGRVIDVGPHEELLERCELYSHLFKTQLMDAGGPQT